MQFSSTWFIKIPFAKAFKATNYLQVDHDDKVVLIPTTTQDDEEAGQDDDDGQTDETVAKVVFE